MLIVLHYLVVRNDGTANFRMIWCITIEFGLKVIDSEIYIVPNSLELLEKGVFLFIQTCLAARFGWAIHIFERSIQRPIL